jgi:hypothetical protein
VKTSKIKTNATITGRSGSRFVLSRGNESLISTLVRAYRRHGPISKLSGSLKRDLAYDHPSKSSQNCESDVRIRAMKCQRTARPPGRLGSLFYCFDGSIFRQSRWVSKWRSRRVTIEREMQTTVITFQGLSSPNVTARISADTEVDFFINNPSLLAVLFRFSRPYFGRPASRSLSRALRLGLLYHWTQLSDE